METDMNNVQSKLKELGIVLKVIKDGIKLEHDGTELLIYTDKSFADGLSYVAIVPGTETEYSVKWQVTGDSMSLYRRPGFDLVRDEEYDDEYNDGKM